MPAGGIYNKIINAGYMFGAEQTQSIAKSSTFLLPKGSYMLQIEATSKLQVQHQKRGTSTWVDVSALGGGGIWVSDGANMRVNNTDAVNALTLSYFAIE